MLDYILALELILSWNERNFGTQNGGTVQPTRGDSGGLQSDQQAALVPVLERKGDSSPW